ncbi:MULTISPECIES: GGDEF domain-containing phosphodiesterase [unclassified Fusibacter]|uniref:GGDEF domain-containing phosphodiesterase n=1 Tax=unclassified Fusibacter TaxID=2624464 RepID=UPI0010139B19|nr:MULTISPECIES: GGDEF domain-containing phosphodiesterase [unclassified Fusibacter]MCK8058080.1 EAL domain-containing protein [Fusibacter sp. A2]NPE20662.1 EAL domain-containing protein [Fusibacter sp. A1]RXV62868.1 phosphodiesterase [Fusibacter sp. A1]
MENAINELFSDELKHLLGLSSIGLCVILQGDVITFFNSEFYEKFDINTERACLSDWINLIDPSEQESIRQKLQEQFITGQPLVESKYRVKTKNGDYIWILTTSVAKYGEDGQVVGFLSAHNDITDKQTYEDHIHNLAYTDVLTGLSNLRMLEFQINDPFKYLERPHLLMFGIDGFGQFYDAYGRRAAERLQFEFSVLLSEYEIKGTKLYHVDRDEFVVLIDSTIDFDVEDYFRDIANDYQRLLFGGRQLQSLKLIGALIPAIYHDAKVDLTLNMARLTIRSIIDKEIVDFVVYDESMAAHLRKREIIEKGLLQAIEDDEIHVYFQPILRSDGIVVRAVEALVRWDNPEIGLIGPDDFIGAAELSGEILALGRYVVEQSCKMLVEVEKKLNRCINVSVNASVVELMQEGFANNVQNVVNRYGLGLDRIAIEVTESMGLNEGSKADREIRELRKLGIKVALDDFGTGYSSFDSLMKHPYTTLKLDRLFMERLATNLVYSDMIGSITKLCHHHQISVVAEGIETIEMVKLAQGMSVDYLQGYYFSRPLTKPQLLDYLEEQIKKEPF